MYRTGHGDCFLLALPGEEEAKPVYVLIDCGYKPGSPTYIETTIKEIADSLRAATGGTIDVAIITHEHQDHVNGITESNFAGISIRETWLPWTEDPKDDLANSLRTRFHDKLVGLVAARRRLQAAGDLRRVERLDTFLEFELGGTDPVFNFSQATSHLSAAGGESMNKKSMKLLKARASNGVQFLRPHEKIYTIPGAPNLRIFPFGPPRDEALLTSLDPQGDEEFHALAAAGIGFGAAASEKAEPPFAPRYRVPYNTATQDQESGAFFSRYYGVEGGSLSSTNPNSREAPDNPSWRRIDRDWLYSAEQLALDMSDYTNNASLVLAFELKRGGKVLFFAADAQRGNWVSWSKKDWKDGEQVVTARDLLGRTVLYKVGHHGSHNATLNGTAADETANLAWMGTGENAREFTAMITAVRAWAETQNGWDHPQKAIKDALLKKTAGRVFQTDTAVKDMSAPESASKAEWKAFLARTADNRLFFDYTIRS
jgi:beta-lactamase superfamily II metal-dependent hydrolase